MTSQQNLVCDYFLNGNKKRVYSFEAKDKQLLFNNKLVCYFKDNDLILRLNDISINDYWIKNRITYLLNSYYKTGYDYKAYSSDLDKDNYNIIVRTKNYIPFVCVLRSELNNQNFKIIKAINISDNKEYNITQEFKEVMIL